MINAGSLDRVLVIERKTVTQDETGQPIETWTTWKVVKAGKKDMRASERFRSNQTLAEEVTTLITHWFAGLTATDRLLCENKRYDVTAIAEIGRRRGLEITGVAIRV